MVRVVLKVTCWRAAARFHVPAARLLGSRWLTSALRGSVWLSSRKHAVAQPPQGRCSSFSHPPLAVQPDGDTLEVDNSHLLTSNPAAGPRQCTAARRQVRRV